MVSDEAEILRIKQQAPKVSRPAEILLLLTFCLSRLSY